MDWVSSIMQECRDTSPQSFIRVLKTGIKKTKLRSIHSMNTHFIDVILMILVEQIFTQIIKSSLIRGQDFFYCAQITQKQKICLEAHQGNISWN